MKKKLTIILALVLMICAIPGCGKKNDSSFFKEIKKMQEIKTGTAEAIVDISLEGDDVTKNIPATFVKDGKVQGKLKIETATQSAKKTMVKLYLQFLSDEYDEITTFIFYEDKLYLDAGKFISYMKKVDATVGAQIEVALNQMGVMKDWASIDLNQLKKYLGLDETKTVDATKFVQVIKKAMDSMDENFKDLQGTDDDEYTFCINEKNAEQAVEALIKLCENNLKEYYVAFLDFYIDEYGENTVVGKAFKDAKEKADSEIGDSINEIKSNKDKMINAIKDSDANIVAKASVTGKKDSRKGKISIETGKLKIDDLTMSISYSMKVEEGKTTVDVSDKNSVDLTSYIIMYYNYMLQSQQLTQ